MHKAAFIGAGGRSSVYLRNYAPEPDIEVVAVADPDANLSLIERCPVDFAYDDAGRATLA